MYESVAIMLKQCLLSWSNTMPYQFMMLPLDLTKTDGRNFLRRRLRLDRRLKEEDDRRLKREMLEDRMRQKMKKAALEAKALKSVQKKPARKKVQKTPAGQMGRAKS